MWCPLLCFLALSLILAVPSRAVAQKIEYFDTGEEFVGPFPSWKNVKTDYGAKGDGVADDTAAIQAAFDALRNVQGNSWSTLYFPAGIYRITATLRTMRKEHNDWLGCQIIGEDPATTIIRWDGGTNQWMWGLDAWYCKVSRFTFDGRNKAEAGLMRWNNFSTYCELSDLWFQDIPGSGICLGSGTNDHEGQAEHAIERCRFKHCGTGILTADWNTMDIYIWWCLFEDCERGIFNKMGGYQAFQNVFLRSKAFDMGTQNNMVFNIVNNTSIGSKCFLNPFAGRAHIQGNRIFEPTDSVAMPAKETVIGNLIRSRDGASGPCIGPSGMTAFLAENVFTVGQPIAPDNKARNLGPKVVTPGAVRTPAVLRLPAPPARLPVFTDAQGGNATSRRQKVFEVRSGTGDDAAELQAKLDAAAAEPDAISPVVHLPKGKLNLKRTVVLPARKRICLTGDGGSENGTVLGWSGSGPGPGLRLAGPSRATVRDLSLIFVDSGADALAIEQCDQVGGRVLCDQVVCSGNEPSKRCHIAILVDGVENSDVTCLNGGWGEFERAGVLVKGGPALKAGASTPGQVALLLGALGNNETRLIDVQDGGRVLACGFRDETPKAGSLIELGPASSGFVSILGMSWAATPSTNIPFIALNGFNGTLAFVGNSIGSGYDENPGSFFIRISGDGSRTRVLCAGNEFSSLQSTSLPKVWKDESQPKAESLLLDCIGGGVNKTKYAITNMVSGVAGAEPDEELVFRMLGQVRLLRIEAPQPRPAGVSDVRLQRVLVRAAAGRIGLTMKR